MHLKKIRRTSYFVGSSATYTGWYTILANKDTQMVIFLSYTSIWTNSLTTHNHPVRHVTVIILISK